mmetsp:Transcript_7754/g.23721  ORF Transcript_7754/g.23721 Transcript_7754/m.23721 type:complete len:259 (+) Transcript_7754:425-1201(+)
MMPKSSPPGRSAAAAAVKNASVLSRESRNCGVLRRIWQVTASAMPRHSAGMPSAVPSHVENCASYFLPFFSQRSSASASETLLSSLSGSRKRPLATPARSHLPASNPLPTHSSTRQSPLESACDASTLLAHSINWRKCRAGAWRDIVGWLLGATGASHARHSKLPTHPDLLLHLPVSCRYLSRYSYQSPPREYHAHLALLRGLDMGGSSVSSKEGEPGLNAFSARICWRDCLATSLSFATSCSSVMLWQRLYSTRISS